MAYPYANSVPGLKATIQQLRSVFPGTVNADTLKKWSVAPNNETYVLNVLRFLSVVDEQGKKRPDAAKVFLKHDDAEFYAAFAELVEDAYGQLFESWGEQAWSLDRSKLIGFFRAEDDSSALVGERQARTFQALSELAGKSEGTPERVPAARKTRAGEKGTPVARVQPDREPAGSRKRRLAPAAEQPNDSRVGLTVRIEINLPVADSQDVYDRIFKSLRENLIES